MRVSWWDPVTKQNKAPKPQTTTIKNCEPKNQQLKPQKTSQILSALERCWPSNWLPKLSPRPLAFFLERVPRYLSSSRNLFKCCSWHSYRAVAAQRLSEIWVWSLKLKCNFYRHAQYSRSQKHSCIFSKLECSFRVFKLHTRFRFWIRVWEGNSFFFCLLGLNLIFFFKKKVGCEDLFLWRWDVDTEEMRVRCL